MKSCILNRLCSVKQVIVYYRQKDRHWQKWMINEQPLVKDGIDREDVLTQETLSEML